MENKNNKFQFASIEEILEKDISNEINVVSSPEKVDGKDNNSKKLSSKMHFSFEARIIVSVVLILIMFSVSCLLAFKVSNHTTNKELVYVESSDVKYEVCLKSLTCEKENISYDANNINIVKIHFDYKAKYDEFVKYNKKYYISAISTVYNKDDNYVVNYNKENYLVDNKSISGRSNTISIKDNVTVDYNKYRELVSDYVNDNSIAQVEIALYISDNRETRKISSVIIPLTFDKFEVERNVREETNRVEDVEVNKWDTYSITLAILSSILTVCSLMFIYKVTRLVMKVTNNKSSYQQEVDAILKEYDSIIIIARDGYESSVERELVKVETFNELLEIKNKLNKPIVFSKVNEVKCEFIIEDKNKLYKYVLKEVDLEENS